MSAPTAARPRGFALVIPDFWARLDLDPAALANARREAMAQATSVQQRLDIDDLFDQARTLLRAARRHGALWAAGTATMFDDGLFVGQAMVFAVSAPGGQPFDLPTLTRALGARDEDETDLGARAISTVRLPHVDVPVVRIAGLERVQVAAEQRVTLFVLHHFIPLPGSPEQYLMVSALSPNLQYRTQLTELFDALAGTFRFTDD